MLACTRYFLIKMRRFELLLIVSALALVALYAGRAGPGFPLDDSWIYQSAARTLARTGEWALVPGHDGIAVTSPLYTLALALGYKLGVAHLLWTHLLGGLTLGLNAILIARMAHRCCQGNPASAWIGGLLTLATWQLVWAAAAGMETSLFCLLTTALIYVAWRRPIDAGPRSYLRYAAALGGLAGLSTLARPEGIVFAGLTLLAVLARDGPALGGRARSYIGTALLIPALLVLPGIASNIQQTGAILPATATAKIAQFRPMTQLNLLTRIEIVAGPALVGGPALLLPGALIYLWQLARRGPRRASATLWLPIVWLAALVTLYAALLPAGYHHGRYLLPALPPLVLVGSIGLTRALARWTRTMLARVIAKTWLLACLIISAVFALLIAPPIYQRDVAIVNEEMVVAANWIAAQVPSEAALAAHDIGALAYFAERAPVDLAVLLASDAFAPLNPEDDFWTTLEALNVDYLAAFPYQIPAAPAGRQYLCLVFGSEGTAALQAGGVKMAVFRLAWDGAC